MAHLQTPPASRPPSRLAVGPRPARRLGPLSGLALLLLATAVVVGCAAEVEEPAEAPAVRVENPQLGIALADVPPFFRVASNEGEVIELVPADPATAGLLRVTAETPEIGGVNLVQAIENHQADLESRPDGVFKGQRELGGPLGTAFYSRGQFTGDSGPMEETTVFMVHPDGARQLALAYTYPQGEDSGARLQEQLFVVLGEVESLEMAADGEEATGGEG